MCRGSVLEPEDKIVMPAVEEQFGFAAMRVVSFADLFAGKLVAALDRQHPRDLFDVHGLLSNEGISGKLRAAFVVYLIGHHRRIESLLTPPRKELRQEFARGLAGMMACPIDLSMLIQTREELIGEMIGRMPDAHREFLQTFAKGASEWKLLKLSNIGDLPAVRWRLKKLRGLKEECRSALARHIEAILQN